MSEAEYDEAIAPLLMDVARKCEALGMSLIARVSWGGGAGSTQMGEMDAAQRLTQIAAHSGGNIDALCLTVLREFDCSRSAVLHRFTNTPTPPAPQE